MKNHHLLALSKAAKHAWMIAGRPKIEYCILFRKKYQFYLHCISKNIPDILAKTWTSICRILIISAKYYVKIRQSKADIFCHLTWLVFLHYPWNSETRKLHLFTQMMYVALPTGTQTHWNWEISTRGTLTAFEWNAIFVFFSSRSAKTLVRWDGKINHLLIA